MNREDIQKLIGGYGAGILTPEEEQILFAAALDDQSLFDALAREQPLRDLLQDPAARAGLLAALADRPLPWYRRVAVWAMRPRSLAALAAVFCMAIAVTVWQARRPEPRQVLTAQVSPQPAVHAPEPAAIVSKAIPAPAAPKARVAGARKPKATRAKKTPAEANELKVEATGAVAGVPQVLGQLTAPAPKVPENAPVLPSPAPAAAPQVPQPQAAIGALYSPAAPAEPPLRWSVLRRQPDGELAAADAGSLTAGDTVTLRLESKAAGYVYVLEQEKVLASSHVEPGKPFDAAIEPQGPGRRDLQLWFSTSRMNWPAAGRARLEMSRMNAGTQTVSGLVAPKAANAPAGRGGASPASPVSVAITLNYR